ncbi:ras-related protein rab-5c [Anaeramoeba flamelloides]|uniref:Ras-related protein rab-5c n=1 Tax=Anaeramoeba flamelloides TaxID=1746091 RepID=A0ABQ8Y3E7_9EUKA|nr:ras-related protein rab-5c [Anaeramoeba flamelloides]
MSSVIPTISFKIVVLGESAVGKTSVLNRYATNKFYQKIEPTIGSTNFQKTINQLDYKIKLLIWDTAGQERFHSLAQMYYRGAKGALVIYDVQNVDSFERAKEWVEELRKQGDPNVQIALVANKIDLPDHMVDKNEAIKYAKENQLLFKETSAKTGEGVTEAFISLAKSIPLEIGESSTNFPNSNDEDFLFLRNGDEKQKKNSKDGCC